MSYKYQVTAKDFFFSKNQESAKEINKWVEEQTHNKIKDLIPASILDKDTMLVLVSALYFKASWYEPSFSSLFSLFLLPSSLFLFFCLQGLISRSGRTRSTPPSHKRLRSTSHQTKYPLYPFILFLYTYLFYCVCLSLTPIYQSKVQMMYKRGKKIEYEENEVAKWVRLPYKPNGKEFNAVFILPQQPGQLSDVIPFLFSPGILLLLLLPPFFLLFVSPSRISY